MKTARRAFAVPLLTLVLTVAALAAPVRGASIHGQSAGVFLDPSTDPFGSVSGVGTATFYWGVPASNNGRCWLAFEGAELAPLLGEPFVLGNLSYYNGTTHSGTNAVAVDLQINYGWTSPGAAQVTTTYLLDLSNTWNVTNDPVDSADAVALPTSFGPEVFEMDGTQYTLEILGFFEGLEAGSTALDYLLVEEGQSDYAVLLGVLSQEEAPLPVPVPEPGTFLLLGSALLGLAGIRRRRHA